MPRNLLWLAGLIVCLPVAAQQSGNPDLREILDRLAKVEQQNRELLEEVRSLRERIGPAPVEPSPAAASPISERLEVAEQRIADVAQTRIATENRLPVTLTGMLLFNAYLNGKASAGGQYPVVVPPAGRESGAGATFRQTILGLRYDGPTALGGAKVNGSLYMDFFGGGTGLNQTFRLRVASLDVAWKRTTLGFAFDKPIIAFRDPDSLAQVGVSPLTGAGNLWLWQPQFRAEHRIDLGDTAGFRFQGSLYQTAEAGTGVSSEYSESLAASRPGYEGRAEFWKQSGPRRLEIATGYHASSTHVAGLSAPSRIATVDWLFRPVSRLQLTGTFFSGRNMGVIGGLRQGVTIFARSNGSDYVRSVNGYGGWTQLKITASRRATFNLFGGQQDDRNRDLLRTGILKNQTYGGNIVYRWGPNLLTSFEATQTRTTYDTGTRLNPHYDLAFAYLF